MAIIILDDRCNLRKLTKKYEASVSKDSAVYNQIQLARRRLEKEVEEWHAHQTSIMGQAIATLKAALPGTVWPRETAPDGLPEELILPIPSNLPPSIRFHALFLTFTEAELRLRQGVANDLLRLLRRKLGLSSFLRDKNSDEFGQKKKTRSGKVISAVYDDVQNIRKEYNTQREKMLLLGERKDSHNYRPLTEADCRPLQIHHTSRKGKERMETEKEVRWIWREGGFRTDLEKWELEGK